MKDPENRGPDGAETGNTDAQGRQHGDNPTTRERGRINGSWITEGGARA